jgi:hypothetical protein
MRIVRRIIRACDEDLVILIRPSCRRLRPTASSAHGR